MTALGWRVESRWPACLSRVGRTRANVSVLVCGLTGTSHTGRVGGVAGGFSASPLSREVTLREVGESAACRMSPRTSGRLSGVWLSCGEESSQTNVRVPRGVARGIRPRRRPTTLTCRYLVDPASSHMLVSKTKPCMSKYERFVL